MKLHSTIFVAAGAAFIAAGYAAIILKDHAEAYPSAQPSLVVVPQPRDWGRQAEVPAPRDCRLDAGIDTACTFN